MKGEKKSVEDKKQEDTLENKVKDLTERIVESMVEVFNNNERTGVIVASSHIESLLGDLLKKRLLVFKNSYLGFTSILGTFSSKIELSYALGVIDNPSYDIFNKIRNLRNDCAHNILLSFDKGAQSDKVEYINGLMKASPNYITLRKKLIVGNISENKATLLATFITLIVRLEVINSELKAKVKKIDSIFFSNLLEW